MSQVAESIRIAVHPSLGEPEDFFVRSWRKQGSGDDGPTLHIRKPHQQLLVTARKCSPDHHPGDISEPVPATYHSTAPAKVTFVVAGTRYKVEATGSGPQRQVRVDLDDSGGLPVGWDAEECPGCGGDGDEMA